MLQAFIDAIRMKRLVRVIFFSQEDRRDLTRKCAPMDYGPSRRAADKSDRFHVWDFESDEGAHTLSLPPGQVVQIHVLDEHFDPATFVTWDTTTSTTRPSAFEKFQPNIATATEVWKRASAFFAAELDRPHR